MVETPDCGIGGLGSNPAITIDRRIFYAQTGVPGGAGAQILRNRDLSLKTNFKEAWDWLDRSPGHVRRGLNKYSTQNVYWRIFHIEISYISLIHAYVAYALKNRASLHSLAIEHFFK